MEINEISSVAECDDIVQPFSVTEISSNIKHASDAKNHNRAAMRMVKCAVNQQANIQAINQPLEQQFKTGALQKAVLAQQVNINDLLDQAFSEKAYEAMKFLIEHGANINHPNQAGKTFLVRAVETNDFEQVRFLLQFSPNLEISRPQDNTTPLAIALKNRNERIATILVETGADVNVKVDGRLTAICYASRMCGFYDLSKLLVNKGANLNTGANDFINPLFLELERFLDKNITPQQNYQRLDFIRYLLEHDADVNIKFRNQETFLIYACYRGDKDAVKLLCEFGADVNVRDNSNRRPIDIAVFMQRQDLVDILRMYDNIEAKNAQLNEAVRLKDKDKIAQLLQAGAQINNKAQDGTTPLYKAFMQGDADFAEFLVRNGASMAEANLPSLIEIVEKQFFKGETLIKLASFHLNNGTNPNSVDKFGRPLISVAVMVGNADLTKLLVNNRANVEPSVRINGMTPLMMAVHFKNEQITKILTAAGANVNPQTDGESLITLAVRGGVHGIVEDLLKHGCQPNNCGSGDLAMNIAIRSNRLDLVNLLTTYGADLNLLKNSHTPLIVAIQSGFAPIVEYLLSKGARHDLFAQGQDSPMALAMNKGRQDIVAILLRYGANHERIGH